MRETLESLSSIYIEEPKNLAHNIYSFFTIYIITKQPVSLIMSVTFVQKKKNFFFYLAFFYFLLIYMATYIYICFDVKFYPIYQTNTLSLL